MKYREIKKYKYQLVEDFTCTLTVLIIRPVVWTPFISLVNGVITIKKGYAWDGPSGPTIDTLNFMTGSLVHDALYQLIREGHLSKKYRKKADEELRRICLQEGMSKFRAWYVYKAVRIFGRFCLNKKNYPVYKVIEV